MRTLIISDLHLGSLSGTDVLRRAELREPLLEAAAGADRLVLLGDVLELRHGPPRDAMNAARPFFEDLGRALAGRELIITAGNHDHALIEPWLSERGEVGERPPLGVEQLLDPAEASPMLERLAEWASPARVRVAYPGLWVRPDAYATHGHYLDCHLTVPTLERLSIGVMSRVLGRPPASLADVADYEALLSPPLAWRDAVARSGRTGSALNGTTTVGAWRALRGDGHRQGARAELRRRALVAGFQLTVAGLNRAGVGPLRADLSSDALRRAGLEAMAEVALHLGLGDAYLIFGHTHRAGPLPGDSAAEWHPGNAGTASSAVRLVNAGCWTYAPIFLTSEPGESPYWPGTCVRLEDSGPPLLEHMLSDRSHAQLMRPLA